MFNLEKLYKVWQVIESNTFSVLSQQEELFTLKKQIETQLLKNEQIISIIGNISSGKSSVLNSFCNCLILPTQGAEETKLPITIQFIENENYLFRFIIKENGMNVTKEIIANSNDKDLDLIYNCITELNNNYNNGVENFECFLECCNSDILNFILNFKNIKIIDTPGVNGNYQELQNVTRKIIEYSNIIIVTLNLNELDVKDSLIDLFNLLKPYKDSIIILITKLDTDLKNRNKKQIYKKEIGEEEIEKIKDCKNKLFKYYDLDIAEERIFGYSSEIELDGRTIHFEKLMNYINQMLMEKNSDKYKNECIIKLCQKSCQLIDNNLKLIIKQYTVAWLKNLKYLKYSNNLNNIHKTFKDKIVETLKEKVNSTTLNILSNVKNFSKERGNQKFFSLFSIAANVVKNKYEQNVIDKDFLKEIHYKLMDEFKNTLLIEFAEEVNLFNLKYILSEKSKTFFETNMEKINDFLNNSDRQEEVVKLFEEEFNEITNNAKNNFIISQQQFEKEIIVNETEIKRLSLNIKNINETLKDLLKNNTDFKIYNCKNLNNPNELIIYDPITNIETTFQKSIFFATSNSSLHSLINENKTLILKTALSIDHDQPYKREIEILEILCHPIFSDYYVKIYGEVKEENSCDKRGLLMERYKSNAEVYFIENERHNQSLMIDIALKLAIPISVLHRFGIIHRDIKLANYLLDENNNIFLTDFGYSKDIATESNSNSTPLGTLGYIAPEFNYDIQACNDKVDVWSLGIVLYEIACGVRFNRAVTNQEEYKTAIQEIEVNLTKFKGYLNTKFIELILKMVEYDPTKRISIEFVIIELETIKLLI
ncbi:hypothetical protein ABK040_005365 [Willaertia magna]